MAFSTASIIKLSKKYLNILNKNNIPVLEALLFGSYATKKARDESDIDIAIISIEFTGDRFSDRRKIVPLRRGLDSRIDPMPYTPEDFAKGGILIDEIKKTGRNNYKLIKISPKLYYGFKCISDIPSIIANLADIPHSKDESIIINRNDKCIPYKW